MSNKGIHKDNVLLYEYLILMFILVVGGMLRLWDMLNIPFTHDELSALGRLRFDSFSDLIQYGVLPDGHPAGVQVFLYYWTSLVGTREILVKIPFIFSGVLSIWLTYTIGKLWFDGTTGLMAAAYISSLQFFVMYSQIARPYISGLFITLLMVYMWSLYFFKNRKIKYLVLFAVFGALSAYNHHFSLLFTAIVGLSGLFLINNKRELLIYSLSGLLIFVLYIPHLQIFFSQLGYGGIGGAGGWLAKPTPLFFIDFIDWLFHFSQVVWGTLIAIFMYLFLKEGDFCMSNHGIQKLLLLISWFLLPIIIGYTYSVLRNPVIQYSMLIFSTPYLFMVFFSYHKNLSKLQNLLLVILVLIVNISTLVFNRDYYNIFYNQPYEQTVRAAIIENSADDVFLIDGGIPYYNEYYFNKYDSHVSFFSNADTDVTLMEFDSIVNNIKESRVVASSLNGEELQILQAKFPYQLAYHQGFTYEIYTFSKENPKDAKIIERELIASTNFKEELGNWKDVKSMIISDTVVGNNYCLLQPENEWGPSITFDLQDISPSGLGIIDVELEILMPDVVEKCLIVSSINKGDEVIAWKALNFELYKLKPNEWKTIYYSVDIQSALKGNENTKGMKLKINVWNISKTKLLIDYINIYSKQGNQVRYALFKDFR